MLALNFSDETPVHPSVVPSCARWSVASRASSPASRVVASTFAWMAALSPSSMSSGFLRNEMCSSSQPTPLAASPASGSRTVATVDESAPIESNATPRTWSASLADSSPTDWIMPW
jgi:hypothetical protein